MLGKQGGFRDLKLSQTREEVHLTTQSLFIQVIYQGECCPGPLFEQDNQPQNSRQDLGRFLPENRENQPRESKQYPISRQDCPSQWTAIK